MSAPILTIALNPALDLTVRVDTLTPGEVNKAQSGTLHAAGKGLNVARVLRDLNHDVHVSGFIGEDNQGPFIETCQRDGLDNQFMVLPGATRINVKVSEQSQRVTDINLPGLHVPVEKFDELLSQVRRAAENCSAVVLAGSLPPGLDENAYGQLINTLRQARCPVLLDTSGEAFARAVRFGPTLVKPNREELEEWLGTSIQSEADLAAAADRLFALGVEQVVISDGANGCYWFRQRAVLKATPPRVEVVSTVGAGDSLVAGLAHALVTDCDPVEGLKLACAISAHAVEQVGVGVQNPDRLNELQQAVQVSANPIQEAI
ncbi:1-phosphofructokinase [Reinekea blandensis]|uniref:Phosphofructokinase n=1 Tax=Reinekea blandensis MED297 TaxID=314283 RepID=A4BB47_9GAMM|nr:1-phosphofructokinase [Reinekea blandensis]EAR10660.1 PfkB [Reinekea sp. MED297] [Reinekea blandensis MED297]